MVGDPPPADAVRPGYRWWQHGIVYQVYPRSFQDSNGDGIGDLPGMLRRLPYLRWLGVTAIWISPIYRSPMADFGYDISDYQDIDPLFGTLEDFQRVVDQAHRLGMKLIMDFVPNHSSDRHPWFEESRRSRSSATRHWYLWRDPASDGGPPNNWQSEFGGPAWTLDPATEQYYYHAYLPEQPDLNWREPAVRDAMHRVMRFWLERGVDGFRVDAVHMLLEDEALQNNPPNLLWRPGMSPARRLLRSYTADLPETHRAIGGMRRVLEEYDDRVLIGEAYLPIDRLMLYYGEGLQGCHLPFNFHLISTPWSAEAIAELIREYESALPVGGWPNWVLGNHDKSRLLTRLGGVAQARLAALLLLTLRGTPTLYYGDEIAMHDGNIADDEIRDPWERRVPGLGLGRDPSRTPMQWSGRPGAGFSSARPWLPMAEDSSVNNVDSQSADPGSMLNLYRRLIELRSAERALSIGEYREVLATPELLVYERQHESRRLLIALNFSATSQELSLQQAVRIRLSNISRSMSNDRTSLLNLCAHEGVIAECFP
jgi:alpha-glucosidase